MLGVSASQVGLLSGHTVFSSRGIAESSEAVSVLPYPTLFSQAEAGEHARRRLALAEAALADLQKSLSAAQAEKHAVDLAVQRERERCGHPQTVRCAGRSTELCSKSSALHSPGTLQGCGCLHAPSPWRSILVNILNMP